MGEVDFYVKKEDDETDARIGKLTVNGISIQTPVLWMGTLVKSKPRPWQYFTINNIMVNAYDVISRGKNDTETIFKNGIHNYLDFSQGLIMMDSGGFQLLMRKRKVLDVKKLILLYEQAKPDIGVILEDGQQYIEGEFERVGILRNDAVVAEFPYTSKMSIIFGALRVYPLLNKYIEDNGLQKGPVIEIYDLANGKIQYISGLIAPLPQK